MVQRAYQLRNTHGRRETMGNKVNRWECNVCGKKCTAIAESITGECKKSGVCTLTVAEIPNWKEVIAEPKDADKALGVVLKGLRKDWSIQMLSDGSCSLNNAVGNVHRWMDITDSPSTVVANAIEASNPKPTREQSLELVAEWASRTPCSDIDVCRALERIKETKEES
jgi:hypothetical protein